MGASSPMAVLMTWEARNLNVFVHGPLIQFLFYSLYLWQLIDFRYYAITISNDTLTIN